MERYLTREEGRQRRPRRGRVAVRHACRTALRHRRRRRLPRSRPGRRDRWRSRVCTAAAPRCCSCAPRAGLRLAFSISPTAIVDAAGGVRRARSSSTIAPTSRGWRGAGGVHVGQDDSPPDAVRARARRRRSSACPRTPASRWTRPLDEPRRLRRGRTGVRHGHQGHRLHRRRSRPGAATPARPAASRWSPSAASRWSGRREVIAAGAGVGRGHHRPAAGGDPEARVRDTSRPQ